MASGNADGRREKHGRQKAIGISAPNITTATGPPCTLGLSMFALTTEKPMTILPTTKQVSEWISVKGSENLDTLEKVAAMFEHVAYMAAMNAATQCLAVCDEHSEMFCDENQQEAKQGADICANEIRAAIREARKP